MGMISCSVCWIVIWKFVAWKVGVGGGCGIELRKMKLITGVDQAACGQRSWSNEGAKI